MPSKIFAKSQVFCKVKAKKNPSKLLGFFKFFSRKFFFYKLEKSEGKVSKELLPDDPQSFVLFFPKTLFPISSIF